MTDEAVNRLTGEVATVWDGAGDDTWDDNWDAAFASVDAGGEAAPGEEMKPGVETDPGDQSEPDAGSEAAPPLRYPNVEAWVGGWLAAAAARQLGGPFVWCAEWWRHVEAVSRLEAMWRTWEALRHDAVFGMSVWWRDHADPHLAVLLSRDGGPFAGCGVSRHTELPDLASSAPPAGWWGIALDPAEAGDESDEGVADLDDVAPDQVRLRTGALETEGQDLPEGPTTGTVPEPEPAADPPAADPSASSRRRTR